MTDAAKKLKAFSFPSRKLKMLKTIWFRDLVSRLVLSFRGVFV